MNEKIWDHFQNNHSVSTLAFAGSLPRYRFLANKIGRNSRVLNIGVGNGGFERLLLEKDKVSIYCLDPSQDTIETLKKELLLGENAKRGYSQNIPFENSFFDYVVMSEVLEHLSDSDLEETLIEVKRVLKPEGIFMGTVPANEVLETNQAVCPKCGEIFHRWGHQQSFSISKLTMLLSRSGFKTQKVETRAFSDWTKRSVSAFVKNAIRWLLGRFGSPVAQPNIYFCAQKA